MESAASFLAAFRVAAWVRLTGCRLAVLVAFGVACPLLIHAQEIDSTRVAPPDSLEAASMVGTEVAERPATPWIPFNFSVPPAGDVVDPRRPQYRPVDNLTGILARTPGSFVYDFGAIGWPDAWSPWALDPNRIRISYDGISLNDLVTGRPRHDLLPLSILEPIHLQRNAQGAAVTAEAVSRDFEGVRPITELRYRSSSTGMQGAAVVHAQAGQRRLLGQMVRTQWLGAYHGRAASNEYAGSRERRTRTLVARYRVTGARASLELRNTHHRRRVGAHGGVQPIVSTVYNSIYQRLGATVRNENADRQTIRNDLALVARTRFLRQQRPTTWQGSWTTERHRYTLSPDTLTGRVRRFAADWQQPLGRLDLTLHAARERVYQGDALPDSLGLTRTRLDVTVADTLRLGTLDLGMQAGWHAAGFGVTYPSAHLRLSRQADRWTAFVEAQHTGEALSWIALHGFGTSLAGDLALPGPRLTLVRGGIHVALGAIEVEMEAFAHQRRDAYDLFEVAQPGTAEVERLDGSPSWVGGALGVHWRRAATRGVYASLQPSLTHFTGPGDERSLELAETLPAWFGRARLGLRTLLFQGDLDLDLYLQGRAWSAFQSRSLHTPTGLLVVRPLTARSVPASGVLDVYAEAGVRTATIFVGYEHFLAGTQLLLGNQLVPDYPLAEQVIRLGVHWPIFN